MRLLHRKKTEIFVCWTQWKYTNVKSGTDLQDSCTSILLWRNMFHLCCFIWHCLFWICKCITSLIANKLLLQPKSGFSNSNCSEGYMGVYEVIRGLHYDWRNNDDTGYLNLARSSFHVLFLEKGVLSYWQVISSCLCVRLMELVHSLAEHFLTPVNELNNLNVNYFKNPKKHHGPHKMPSRATRGPVWVPWSKFSSMRTSIILMN